MWFWFDGFDFHTHASREEAEKAASAALDEFRDAACDGWDECVHNVSWGRISQIATVTEDRPRTDEDYGLDPDIEYVMQIELRPSGEMPNTSCGVNELQIANERIKRLEAALGYAITTETSNTRSWMEGFQAAIDTVLAADGDHRRCTFDGQQLRLRSIRQVAEQPSDS